MQQIVKMFSTLMEGSVSGHCLFFLPGLPLHCFKKRKADLSQFWSVRLTVGKPRRTNGLHLRDGLRQMETCIPFQGKNRVLRVECVKWFLLG